MMSIAISSFRSRKLLIALILVTVTAFSSWGAYEWLVSSAQTKLNERLSARGLSLNYSAKTWSLWGGLTLRDAVLGRLNEAHEPLIVMSALQVGLLWRDAWHARAAVTRWRANDATLTMHDNDGAVTLQHFTTDFIVRDDKIEIAQLDTNSGALAFALTGEIIPAATANTPPETAFALNLKPLRAVLDALEIKSDKDPFTITGTFALDLRGSPVIWSANLNGSGKQLEWRGVPMVAADIDAKLSQANLKLGTQIKFANGSAKIEFTRAGWDQEPLIMSGTLTDSAGRTDEFQGEHQSVSNTLRIANLSGSTDLLELARNFPALAMQIPTTVSMKKFPDIIVQDLVWQAGVQPPELSLASLKLRTPAAVVVMVGEHPLAIDHLTGKLSREHHSWQFDDVKGQLPNGHVVFNGNYDGNTLNMSGTVTDSAGRTDDFKGQLQGPTNKLTIARLSGDADLVELAHNIPGLATQMPASVKFITFPDILVQGFVWNAGGRALDWTLDSLQLRKSAAITVMIREQPLAIDHLTGRLSYDHQAWRFEDMKGQLLGGHFALDASYDGKTLSKADVSLQSLHLAQLSPWVGKVKPGLEAADMSLTYHGAICNDTTHSTGSGTLLLTNAPVVHVPLLDQAYQLFPQIIPREQSENTGEVQVDFSLTKGIATIEPMKARGQSVVVTASGTVDLNKRVVDGRARANLRGVAGVALSPVSVLFLEMQVSGPLDDISVSPLGVLGAAKSAITGTSKMAIGTAKLSTHILREGLSVPFEALGMFDNDKAKPDK